MTSERYWYDIYHVSAAPKEPVSVVSSSDSLANDISQALQTSEHSWLGLSDSELKAVLSYLATGSGELPEPITSIARTLGKEVTPELVDKIKEQVVLECVLSRAELYPNEEKYPGSLQEYDRLKTFLRILTNQPSDFIEL